VELGAPFRGTHGIFYGHGWFLPEKFMKHQKFIDKKVKELLFNKLEALKDATEFDNLNSKNKNLILSSVSWLQESDPDNDDLQKLLDHFSEINGTGDLNQENDLSDDEGLEDQIKFILPGEVDQTSLHVLKEDLGILGESE